jgi:hypothetical protein
MGPRYLTAERSLVYLRAFLTLYGGGCERSVRGRVGRVREGVHNCLTLADSSLVFKDLGRTRAVTGVSVVPRRSRVGNLSLALSWRLREGVVVRRRGLLEPVTRRAFP